ncbi:MAG: trans-aconitate 2-methyltransferase [Verrucomicrobia bacterium]|nr:MAG: trans-aconitate 2-methyltransferase [Verrucomicrobiota bacterium]
MPTFNHPFTMDTWNPDLYLKFETERTRPSHDLVARIQTTDPKRVIDIGCGPGNSTRVLGDRFTSAEITGLDSSPEMIEKAKTAFPGGAWICGDAATHKYEGSYDVIYSNAVLQWIPNQEVLIERLVDHLSPNGILAVQVPGNDASPIQRATVEVARREEWSDRTAACMGMIQYREPAFYYEILSKHGLNTDLWITTYIHILESQRDLIEWYKSTGMKHFLSALPDLKARNRFADLVLEQIVDAYPIAGNGKVLFPFRRIFFTARKPRVMSTDPKY